VDKIEPSSFPLHDNLRNGHGQNNAESEQNLPKKDQKAKIIKSLNYQQVVAMSDQLNKLLREVQPHLVVFPEKKGNKFVMKVIDDNTNELIKELMPHEIIMLAQNLRDKNLNLIQKDV
jgi:uncharacterized FlaG/YvyC family protein